MKKIIIASFVFASLIACNSGGDKEGEKKEGQGEEKKESTNDMTANPDYQKGLDLIAKSDCLTCHKIDEQLTGPAYRDVANKYAGADTAVNYLANKIIKGGTGVWGQVPMTPHASLPEEDAKAMAKYILLLKK
jgi:cytochrome c